MRRSTSALALLGLLWTHAPQPAAQEPAQEPGVAERAESGKSQLRGRVSTAEGKPVAAATIIAYHLSSEIVFDSAKTDRNGNFTITGLPYGYFDIAVETAQGLFVADQVVNLPPSGQAAIKIVLAPGTLDDPAPRGFPGTDATPAGVARVGDKAGGKAFWKSPKGIAIIGGAAALVLLAVSLGGGSDEQPASPSQ